MKNDTTELEETTIPISVRTGLMHRGKADKVHTQITWTGFYITAINYLVRIALEAREQLDDNEINSQILKNDVVFRENIKLATQLTEAFSEWLPDYGSDLYDVLTEKPERPKAAAPKMPEIVSPPAEDIIQHSINILANKVFHVLTSDKVSSEFKHVLGDIIIDAGSEAGINLDNPALAKIALPLIMNEQGFEYSKGIFHTLETMLDTVATDAISDELRAYEGRFVPKEEEKPNVLDLSEQPEDCQRLNKLAFDISNVLKNPLLPEKLYNSFSGELIEINIDTDAPDWILGNLKKMREDEK